MTRRILMFLTSTCFALAFGHTVLTTALALPELITAATAQARW